MSDYQISTERVSEIIASDPRLSAYTAEQVEDICCADWSEGEEHQVWLDTAPAAEIASWAFGGLEDARKEKEIEEQDARRYEVEA
jgi:hypothetical protein